ncbi:ABC transporter permease subunit [Thermococcus sp.]|uniref:ABC transporter permease subunit n=1 Tax=Thermococcus sp. TaxID=35749 RepID=UPI00262779B4|nr:ABC transporter permease subunit [Thermococcus sp.]
MRWGFELELEKGIRTKKIWALVAIVIILYLPMFYSMKQQTGITEKSVISLIISYTTQVSLFFLGIMAIVLGAGAFLKEMEDGTIRIALSKPIKRIEYLLGKFGANFAIFMLIVFIMTAVTLIGLKWVGINVGPVYSDVVILNVLLGFVLVGFITIGYLMSLSLRSSGTAFGVALLVFFLLYLVLPGYVQYKAVSATSYSDTNSYTHIKDEYYTRYLFFAPNAQFNVILDNTMEIQNITEGVYGPVYVGLGHALKKTVVNVVLLVGMPFVYLGLAALRFKRVDLR